MTRPRCTLAVLVIASGVLGWAADRPANSGAWTAATAWSVADEPRLQIGVVDRPTEEQFTRISSALTTAGGEIVIANASSPPELRVFRATGEHLRSFGRAGEGPGEFAAILWAQRVAADTVAVYDRGRRDVLFRTGHGLRPIDWPGTGRRFGGHVAHAARIPAARGRRRFVLGVHRDPLGVEFVRVYDLHKPGATAGES